MFLPEVCLGKSLVHPQPCGLVLGHLTAFNSLCMLSLHSEGTYSLFRSVQRHLSYPGSCLGCRPYFSDRLGQRGELRAEMLVCYSTLKLLF